MKYILLATLFALVLAGCVTTAKFQREQACSVNQASGFKIDRYVVTANHVAVDQFVVVENSNGNEECGTVVARDTVNDIALIKLEKPFFYDYTLGTPHIKDVVNSISNPYGLSFSEVSGEIQHLERIADDGQLLIQIGIDVFFGSSGSPVYNNGGELIGMIVRAMPGTRFTFIIPMYKITSLIKKTNHENN